MIKFKRMVQASLCKAALTKRLTNDILDVLTNGVQ